MATTVPRILTIAECVLPTEKLPIRFDHMSESPMLPGDFTISSVRDNLCEI
jgi:hypothetical protein